MEMSMHARAGPAEQPAQLGQCKKTGFLFLGGALSKMLQRRTQLSFPFWALASSADTYMADELNQLLSELNKDDD